MREENHQPPQEQLRQFQSPPQQPQQQQQPPQQQSPQQQQQPSQQQPPPQQQLPPQQEKSPQKQQPYEGNMQNLKNSFKSDKNASDKVDTEPENPVPAAVPSNAFEEIPAAAATASIQFEELLDENGKIRFKKIFPTRRKKSLRIKKRRMNQNRLLRKSIIPKNALMALNQLKGISVVAFVITNSPSDGCIATVTVNGKEYEGRGANKMAAKEKVSEKAIRDYMLAKMRERPRKMLFKGRATNGNSANNPGGAESMETDDETQDLPMTNLVSYAIHKLFLEWENEGYVIPEMHPPPEPFVRIKLPNNWQAMHPASLLSVMRPGVAYVYKGSTGETPNSILHTLAINVDGQNFEACGRSKKIARRKLAVIVCNALFNTNFDLEASNVPPA